MTIAILLTCFNRREKTLECLASLADQNLPAGFSCQTVLVDDGSTDGTESAVREKFPAVHLIRGDGSHFWCGGMRVAWRAAAKLDPDYYLLVNDDTHLDRDALQTLLEMTGHPDTRTIAVAAIRDPASGARTYGGIRGNGTPVEITGKLEACDTFNANAALVPRAVHTERGGFHTAYTHALGDFDYGYQASRRGIRILQSQRALGTCAQNGAGGTWRDRSLSTRQRLRMLQSTFNRRNSGWKWPLHSVSPFLRIILGR